MPVVDNLNIQISASARKATQSLDTLTKKLDKTSSSLSKSMGTVSKNNNKIASSSAKMTNGLNRTNTAMKKADKSAKSLAHSFGMFYANFFLLIRGFKALWKSIESTADYIEAYNYFNVALGKIGKDWEQQFEQYGYADAEAYANSFSTRLQQSLSRLSGIQIVTTEDGQGLLTETGLSNLGMNIKEITQYASQLASVTNSVGQTGETSLAVASSFTKLAGDISSLFNIDYSSVSQNFQSGLIGQSRALYKYGIDITNATLQTYAYELGLEKAVSEMTQMEKMQLRVLAILDQSKVAWGDLANTIESPSNQIRIFKNNMSELGTIIGQLFIPLLSKVLPLLNGISVALKRLFVDIGTFFGIQLDMDAFGQGYSNLEDDIDGVGDALDDATNSAKKLKNATLGIDELNILGNTDTNTQSGLGSSTLDLTQQIIDATKEYENAWADAFANMEQRTNNFADKIEQFFKPVGDLFKNIGDGFKSAFDSSKIEKYKASIERLGRSILGLFNQKEVKDALGEMVTSAERALGSIIGTAVSVGASLSIGVSNGVADANEEMDKFNADRFTSISNSASRISKNYSDLLNTVSKIATVFEGEEYSKIIGLFTQLADAALYAKIDKFVGRLSDITTLFVEPIVDNGDLIKGILDEIASIIEDLLTPLATVLGLITGNSNAYEDGWFHKFMQALTKLASKDMELRLGATLFVLQKIGDYTEWARGNWEDLVSVIADLFDKEKMKERINGVIGAFQDVFGEVVKNVISSMNNIITAINNALSFNMDIKNPITGKNNTLSFGVNIPLIQLPQYKNGGFPEDGLFFANHNELVGGFSNGKTAVANNGQIIDGIEGGVERAVSRVLAPYLADIAQNTRETADKDLVIGDRDIARANNRGQRQIGARLITEG